MIYVVDDDEDVRYSIKLLLERAGYAVKDFPDASAFQSATNGRDALCLLFDLNLPGLSGLDLLQHLRSQGTQVPALILSGNCSHTEAELRDAGVFHVLNKPAPAKDLLSWVGKACALGRLQA